MKKILFLILPALAFLSLSSLSNPGTNTIGNGQQPQVSVDTKGIVRVVFGSTDQIFCATSIDHGVSFGKPLFVAKSRKCTWVCHEARSSPVQRIFR
jgi:hypothetical protein